MGVLAIAVGVISQQGAIVSWGGALLVGLAVARAVTLVGVTHVRAAGFEMVWSEEHHIARVRREGSIVLKAEVRNRDLRAVRFVNLRAIHSPNLEVSITPADGEVPAGGRLQVDVRVKGLRVGRHGVHGLSLEVRGSPGLFEVPLTFANPFGVEVLPAAYTSLVVPARGARSRLLAERGRTGRLLGDCGDLKEIREHQPGDSFKRIAWKASARRGKLLVREYEIEERDVVWVVLDASVELWAGAAGTAPLDHAVDDAASIISEHIRLGDKVGLVVVAKRILARVPPEHSKAHTGHLMMTLATVTGTTDVDRSYYDEADLAVRVMEHMRPLDPQASHGVSSRQLERVVRRADLVIARAPFPDVDPVPKNGVDKALRRYVAAFGINIPPRLEPDREATDARMASVLTELVREKPRASVIYVCSPAPNPKQRAELHGVLARLPKRFTRIRWVESSRTDCIPKPEGVVAEAVNDALRLRDEVARNVATAALQGTGVRPVKTRLSHRPPSLPPSAG